MYSYIRKSCLVVGLGLLIHPLGASANIITPERSVTSEPNTATVTFQDHANGYGNNSSAFVNGYEYDITIPYIQTSNDLFIKVDSWLTADRVRFELADMSTGNVIATLTDTTIDTAGNNSFEITFTNVPKGEYRVDVYGVDVNGNDIPGLTDYAERIGIGDIILAVGDSLTQGVAGWKYEADPTDPIDGIFDWTHSIVSPDNTSQDNRNFPQAGDYWSWQIAQNRKISFNQSFMSVLNDNLSSCYDYPVFILNQGWSGHNTEDYLRYMSGHDWQNPINQLQPNKAIIQLGANDVYESLPMVEYVNNLNIIIDELISSYNISEDYIWLAQPDHPHDPYDWSETLPKIVEAIDGNGIQAGPLFYNFFGDNSHLISGDDIHPSQLGYNEKGRKWSQTIAHDQGCSFKINDGISADIYQIEPLSIPGDDSLPSLSQYLVGNTINYEVIIRNESNVVMEDLSLSVSEHAEDDAKQSGLFVYAEGSKEDSCTSSGGRTDLVLEPGEELICLVEYILTPYDVNIAHSITENIVATVSDAEDIIIDIYEPIYTGAVFLDLVSIDIPDDDEHMSNQKNENLSHVDGGSPRSRERGSQQREQVLEYTREENNQNIHQHHYSWNLVNWLIDIVRTK